MFPNSGNSRPRDSESQRSCVVLGNSRACTTCTTRVEWVTHPLHPPLPCLTETGDTYNPTESLSVRPSPSLFQSVGGSSPKASHSEVWASDPSFEGTRQTEGHPCAVQAPATASGGKMCRPGRREFRLRVVTRSGRGSDDVVPVSGGPPPPVLPRRVPDARPPTVVPLPSVPDRPRVPTGRHPGGRSRNTGAFVHKSTTQNPSSVPRTFLPLPSFRSALLP